MGLPEILDINAAEALRAQLLSLRHAPLAIDASRVERLGGLCLQTLLAASTMWREDGCAFAIENPSGAFLDHARAMGADVLLCGASV